MTLGSARKQIVDLKLSAQAKPSTASARGGNRPGEGGLSSVAIHGTLRGGLWPCVPGWAAVPFQHKVSYRMQAALMNCRLLCPAGLHAAADAHLHAAPGSAEGCQVL